MPVIVGASIGIQTGVNMIGSSKANKNQKKSNELQARAIALQTKELKRQRERESEQIRRENEKLMNSITNLTDASFGTVQTPGMGSGDKYGDLG